MDRRGPHGSSPPPTFLTEEQAAGLLRLLASASAPGSRLAFDILGKALLRSPFSKPFLDTLAADQVQPRDRRHANRLWLIRAELAAG